MGSCKNHLGELMVGYLGCCKLLGVAKPRLRDCSESIRGREQRLSVNSMGGGKSLCYAVLPHMFDMLRGNSTLQ